MSKTPGSVESTQNKVGMAAAPRERINLALVGSPSVVPSPINPSSASAATIDQAHDRSAAQTVAMAAERLETQPLAQRLDVSPEKPAIKQRLVVAQVAAPKLKFDTDYESVQHAVKFAFDQSVLGPQAQVVMAKILEDAKAATRIKLTGFSDGIGSRLANERVANARAMSIRNELVRNDVEPSKITVATVVVMGVAKTKQPSSQYAHYRRVDVDITKPKQPQIVSLNDRSPAKGKHSQPTLSCAGKRPQHSCS
jgi:outer membrane protein OmpA-like peptidoglycan-associated protein